MSVGVFEGASLRVSEGVWKLHGVAVYCVVPLVYSRPSLIRTLWDQVGPGGVLCKIMYFR